jgi:hypothetical protein
MSKLLLLLAVVTSCSSTPSGMLELERDSPSITVGTSTFVMAYFVDASNTKTATSASWSVDMDGIVTLTPVQDIMKVTGVAPGNVVITASADGQQASTGFTVSN